MFNKKKIIILFLFFSFSFCFFNIANASDVLTKSNNILSKKPKLANIFLSWEITDEDVDRLAMWDLIILDMEHQINNPDKILKIREINPDIIILAYISSQEIRNDIYLYPNLNLRREMFESIPEDWYLKFDNKKISFWPQTWMLNSSNLGLKVNNERWNDYLPQFVKSKIISSGLWDGVFYDNFFDSISWLNNNNIDLDANGFKDQETTADLAWQEGNLKILEKTRELVGYDYVILINSSSFVPYQKYINGRVFEDFPVSFEGNRSWQSNIDSYKSIYSLNVNPKFYIFNLTNNAFSDYEKMRYGLATSLFFEDIYLSFDDKIENHGQTWFYDEYNFDFSFPKSNFYQIENSNLWRRDFRYFSIIVNIGNQAEIFSIDKNFKQIYDWYPSEKIEIKPMTSIIIEPRLDVSGVWLNKTQYQGFNFLGKKVHSSFVIDDNNFAEGTIVDYDSEKVNQLKGSLLDFRKNEIDLNGNGFLERVEGSSRGEKSLVKIFNNQNKLVGVFKAFPDAFRCGVSVAVGDIDGDQKVEIITIPAWGGPHVRIFDFSGKLKYEFFAGDKKNRSFYDLTLKDIDLDGQTKEILIATY